MALLLFEYANLQLESHVILVLQSLMLISLNTRFNILYFVFYIQISRQNSTCSNSSSSRGNISRETSGIVQSWSLQVYPQRIRLQRQCAHSFSMVLLFVEATNLFLAFLNLKKYLRMRLKPTNEIMKSFRSSLEFHPLIELRKKLPW